MVSRRAVIGRAGFNPRPVLVGFVVDNMTVKEGFLRGRHSPPITASPPTGYRFI